MGGLNYQALGLAVTFGTIAVVQIVRGKAPRARAIFAALALLCLLAGVPSLLALAGHPIGSGLLSLIIIGGTIGFVLFFYFDFIRGEHKTPVWGRKAIGGAGGQGGGGSKSGHHRPLIVCIGLAAFALMFALNFHTVISGESSGASQTISTFTHLHGA